MIDSASYSMSLPAKSYHNFFRVAPPLFPLLGGRVDPFWGIEDPSPFFSR